MLDDSLTDGPTLEVVHAQKINKKIYKDLDANH